MKSIVPKKNIFTNTKLMYFLNFIILILLNFRFFDFAIEVVNTNLNRNILDFILYILDDYFFTVHFLSLVTLFYIYRVKKEKELEMYIMIRFSSKREWFLNNIKTMSLYILYLMYYVILCTVLVYIINLVLNKDIISSYKLSLAISQMGKYNTFIYLVCKVFINLLYLTTLSIIFFTFSNLFKNTVIALLLTVSINLINAGLFLDTVPFISKFTFVPNILLEGSLDNILFTIGYWIVLLFCLIYFNLRLLGESDNKNNTQIISLIKYNLFNIFTKKTIFFIIISMVIYTIGLFNYHDMNIETISVLEEPSTINLGAVLNYVGYKIMIISFAINYLFNHIKKDLSYILIRVVSIKNWIISNLITMLIYTIVCYFILVIVSFIVNLIYGEYYVSIDINLLLLNILNIYMFILLNQLVLLLLNKSTTTLVIMIIIIYTLTMGYLMYPKIGYIIPFNQSFIGFLSGIKIVIMYIYSLAILCVEVILFRKLAYDKITNL